MLLFFRRIFFYACIAFNILLTTAALTAQFSPLQLETPHTFTLIEPFALNVSYLWHSTPSSWKLAHLDAPRASSPFDLFCLPQYAAGPIALQLILPWWLLLLIAPTLYSLTFLLLLKPRKKSRPFPIEPSLPQSRPDP